MPYLTCILSHEWLLQHIIFSLVSFFMLVFPLMGVMQYELYAHCHLEVVMCSRTTLLYICAKQNKKKKNRAAPWPQIGCTAELLRRDVLSARVQKPPLDSELKQSQWRWVVRLKCSCESCCKHQHLWRIRYLHSLVWRPGDGPDHIFGSFTGSWTLQHAVEDFVVKYFSNHLWLL